MDGFLIHFNSDHPIYNSSSLMHIRTITRRVLSAFSTTPPFPSSHFTLLSSTPAPDLKATLLQYSHKETKARIYHYLNGDPQAAFASIVKTYVVNDSGCPHILEHLATCGSQKYPVRDPFFNMLRRSVNTYMNAWTGDDFTSYLFSSANPTDWNNLYRVYLDMTLKAGLHELDFRQEGWRWQLNAQGGREFKGIVLNEMKGAYQDADRQMMREINQQLFRGTPYVFDSGGRPADIVNLEYSELRKMYEYYYHPSNIAFYFYGNADISPSLQYLHQEYLSQYKDQSQRYDKVNLTPEPIANRHKTIISHTAQSNSISINFLLGKSEAISPLEAMCLRVLHYLLLEKSNAKFYQKFIESGTAQNLGFSGFNQAKMATFTLTLKGIYPQYTCQQFQEEFQAVLKEMVEKGVEKDRLQEFAHQFQVNLLTPRENNGIRVLEQCMGLLNHRLSMDLFLNPRPYLNEAIIKLQDPNFLSSLITRFFLSNDRMVVVRQLLAEVQSKEEPLVSSVVMEDKVIARQQEELKARQGEKTDPSILPMLRMEDIITPKRLQPVLVGVQSTPTKKYEQYHVKIEEDINFYRLVFSFEAVDEKFLSALTLWEAAVNRTISTHSHGYNQMTALLANHTAGFNVFHSVGKGDEVQVVFEFSSLKKNTGRAFELLGEIVLGPKFEKEHTINAFRAFNNEATEGLVENPMNECLNEAAAQLHRTGALLNSYQRIKESLTIIEEQKVEDLYQLSLWLGHCTSLKLIVHSNQKSILPPQLISTLLRSTGKNMTPFVFSPLLSAKAVTHGYTVNFCGQQYAAPPYLSPEHARISLLLVLLQQDYLHPLIREKGGAYGSGARVRNNGTLSLSSYLDPNSLETFAVFDESVKQLLSRDSLDEVTLLQAKIKQFGEVDRVKIPQNEGITQILKGYSQEDYDNFRTALRTASFKEIVETGRKYLGPSAVKSKCLFGKVAPQGFTEEKLKDFLL